MNIKTIITTLAITQFCIFYAMEHAILPYQEKNNNKSINDCMPITIQHIPLLSFKEIHSYFNDLPNLYSNIINIPTTNISQKKLSQSWSFATALLPKDIVISIIKHIFNTIKDNNELATTFYETGLLEAYKRRKIITNFSSINATIQLPFLFKYSVQELRSMQHCQELLKNRTLPSLYCPIILIDEKEAKLITNQPKDIQKLLLKYKHVRIIKKNNVDIHTCCCNEVIHRCYCVDCITIACTSGCIISTIGSIFLGIYSTAPLALKIAIPVTTAAILTFAGYPIGLACDGICESCIFNSSNTLEIDNSLENDHLIPIEKMRETF